MISSISTIFNKKIESIEECESVSQADIAKVNAEVIAELEELYEDDEIEEGALI